MDRFDPKDWAARIESRTDHGVLDSTIFDTSDGGVSLTGGDRQTLATSGHFVENCHFARQGRWSKCYVPAVLMTGVGHRASQNLIHDHPHCAILYTGNEHLIEFNEIHHIALETGDVGAIYSGRDWTYRGNIANATTNLRAVFLASRQLISCCEFERRISRVA